MSGNSTTSHPLPKRSQRALKIVVGVGFSLALLAYLSLQVEWQEVLRESQELRWWMAIPLIATIYLQMFLRTARWAFLFPTESRPAFRLLFDSLMIGNLASFVLPLRAGEFVRPGVVALKSKTTFSQAFASVVIERFFDLSLVLLTFCFIAVKVPNLDPWVYSGAIILSIVALAVLIMIIIGTVAPHQAAQASSYITRLIERVLGKNKFFGKLEKLATEFIFALGVIRSLRTLAIIALLSCGVWAATYLFFYLFCLAGGHFPADLLLAIAVAVIVALAVAAPSAPGFIGVYQTGCVAAFVLLGYRKETGLAFGLLSHILQYIFIVLAGILSLWHQGVKFREMSRMAAQEGA